MRHPKGAYARPLSSKQSHGESVPRGRVPFSFGTALCSQAMASDVRDAAAAWGSGCGRSLHRGKRGDQPGRSAVLQRSRSLRFFAALHRGGVGAAGAIEADRWHGGKYLRVTLAEPELAIGVEGPAIEQACEAAEQHVSSGVVAALPTAAAGVYAATRDAASRRHRFEEIRARARADIIESKALVERIRAECGEYAFMIAALPTSAAGVCSVKGSLGAEPIPLASIFGDNEGKESMRYCVQVSPDTSGSQFTKEQGTKCG